MQPAPVLSLGSELWNLSLSSQPPPTLASEQTSLSGWWVLVGTKPLWGDLSALPSAPLLLCSPSWLWSFPPTTPSLYQWRGFLVCGNFSSFTDPSQRYRSCHYSFVSVFCFFLLPYPGTWGVSCILGSLRSSASIQYVFCRSFPHVDAFLMYLWGGRWSPRFTSQPSWRSLSV